LKQSFICSIIAMCCFFPLGIIVFINYRKVNTLYK
jgi:hypothetical protein